MLLNEDPPLRQNANNGVKAETNKGENKPSFHVPKSNPAYIKLQIDLFSGNSVDEFAIFYAN